MESFYINMYVSDNTFKQDTYGKESIQAHSRFHQKQVSKGQNVFIATEFKRNSLEDETAYLQLG